MIRGRATGTFTRRKNSVREFKMELDRRFFGSVFVDTKGALVVSHSSPAAYFKRNRRQHWLPSNPLNCADTQRYNQQMLSQTLAPLKRIKIRSCRRSDRLFTTRAKGSSKTGSHKRRKKTLSPSSNKKMTTKDRLRLSSRPSTSAMNSRQNKDSTEVDRMIKSPEELMERLSSGLDIARTVAQEGYASLRNPTAAASSGRNAGNKHDNHLLSARPGPSGINDGSRPIHQKGLVMDANWWFWNLCLAASPAILVALYCQFIVKPEMKIRNEQREKDALSEENEKAKNRVGDEVKIGVDERRDNNENKMSPMRKRQEDQKHHQQQLRDGAPTRKSSSSPEPNGGINEILSSYTRSLISWISEPQSPPTEVSEDCQSHENGTDGVDKRNNKLNPRENQEHRKEIARLEIQRRELKELQAQLQMLQDKIDRQQQQRADPNAGSDGDDSELVSENHAKSEESPSISIGDRMKYATAGGIKVGREGWATLLYWWQSRGRRRQSSDESNGGDDEKGVVATGNGRQLSTPSER